MRLAITGEYPPDWKAQSDERWASAGHRCVRCGHPYKKGEHGKGEWTRCDERCTHKGPLGFLYDDGVSVREFEAEATAGEHFQRPGGNRVVARWRIATVHHLDGNKANCAWWNLLPLCQRCHLTIQGKVNPHQPFMLEHSEWFKPYVAGFYAKKYEGRDITREEAESEMERLLKYESP